VPNSKIDNYYSWTERLKQSIIYIHEQTKEQDSCNEWGEVSELLYLWRGNRKWSRTDVNQYMVQLWQYLEF
jgi:hypothetical protein